uniref:CD44 antigen n=1 Tax=Crocodylus porosus TaxID=8502 RepID=A0A7M4EVP1_CROPO
MAYSLSKASLSHLWVWHVGSRKFNISCRYAGVFHVEKNRRYSLMREDAIVLCRALNSTLPTMEQMEKAYKLGFETCR